MSPRHVCVCVCARCRQGSGVIAAFAQTAEGDVSPNINLARCAGTDEICDPLSSTCVEDRENVSADPRRTVAIVTVAIDIWLTGVSLYHSDI